MDPVRVNIENHVSGDTWDGIVSIGPVKNGIYDMDYPAASARLHFTKVGKKDVSIRFSTDPVEDEDAPVEFPITLENAATWEFVIPPVSYEDWVPVPGAYEGQFEVTDTTGKRWTLYDIYFEVLPDKTK